VVEEVDEIQGDLYAFLNIKELTHVLDLKKEVILTMLHQLERLPDGKKFFKLESILPYSVSVRFHKSAPEELAKSSELIAALLPISKVCQGVYNCSLPDLAYKIGVSPFGIPKMLYQLQNSDDQEISYELENESFVVRVASIPRGEVVELGSEMLAGTRKIEANMVAKLNCMYFVARKVSLPSVAFMLQKEKGEDPKDMYLAFSQQMNDLINTYFQIEDDENMEVQIAGSEEERNVMMPLLYANTAREKSRIESEIRLVLKEFHEGSEGGVDERLKALDIVKILIGIYSDRTNVKRFASNDRLWGKLKDYDYQDLMKIASDTVTEFYLELVAQDLQPTKMRKLN